LSVDGLASYVTAFRRAFRTPWHEKGHRGRPRLIPWPHVAIVQTIKHRKKGRIASVERRIVQGSRAQVTRLLQRSQGGGRSTPPSSSGSMRPSVSGSPGSCDARTPWLGERRR
ncbi:MAG: hypothetical protein J7M34_12815, partial [Anaerolineae bacterium]|nr:hypothetical protein [Anaerolineae bacterium]